MMRLSIISEFDFGKLTKHVKPLLNTMPRGKQKHSMRVAKTLHKSGLGKTAVYAGALHDYLERGGDVTTLAGHVAELGLSPRALHIIQNLSSDEKHDSNTTSNEPLHHVRQVLTAIDDQGLKDTIVLVKMADRIDNMKKRFKLKGKIGPGYLQKSKDLFDFLQLQYRGRTKPFRKLLLVFYDILQQTNTK